MSRRAATSVAFSGVLGILLLACNRATAIPAGAQQVHVTLTSSEVRLEPATVHAGEVYLVLDAPLRGSFAFVEQKSAAAASPGPLSDDDLARLASGDTEGMAIGGLDAGGCSAAEDAEDRGRMGPCGNVMKAVVRPGRYAIVGGTPDADPSSGGRPPLAVLDVVP